MRTLTLALVVVAAGMASACSKTDGSPGIVAPSGLSASGVEATDGALAAALHAKPGRAESLGVTTTIIDFENAEISSDLSGAYVHGIGGVSSILTANVCNGLTWGDWQFDTSGSQRGVGHGFWLDSAVPEGSWGYTIPPQAPFTGKETLPSYLAVKCTCASNLSMFTMQVGTSIQCPLLNRFTRTTGDQYVLNAGAVDHPNDTTNAQITCTRAESDGCAEWDIKPIPNAATQNRAVGRLAQVLSKGKVRAVHLGNFYIRFGIHITRS